MRRGSRGQRLGFARKRPIALRLHGELDDTLSLSTGEEMKGQLTRIASGVA